MATDAALTVRQTAEILGVSCATVRRIAAAGQLASFRVGAKGQLRFSPSDVRRYIGAHRMQTVPGAARPHVDTAGLVYLASKPTSALTLSCPRALAAGGVTIDAGNGVIAGVSVLTAGPALGHGFYIDNVMLRQVAQQINAAGGVPSRLSHPSISDGVESLLGRVKNARVDGERVRGDLHLAGYAAKSPSGNLREYVLSLAGEDPTAVGLSIVFDPDDFEESDDGRLLGRSLAVTAVDLVNSPAANPRGLLSKQPTTKGLIVKKRVKTYLQSLGLSTTATSDEAQAFLEALTGDERAEADRLASDADDAVLLERRRCHEITALARELDLGEEWAGRHVGAGTALADARADALAELRRTRTGVPVTVGEDRGAAGLREHLTDALALRFGAPIDKPARPVQAMRSLQAFELCRKFLEGLGIDTGMMSRDSLVRVAWNPSEIYRHGGRHTALWQGTGSFANILADAMGKTARLGYAVAPRTWDRWARRTTAADFKEIKRVSISDAPALTERAPGGEAKYVQVGDVGETYVLAEYANIIALTRRALVNDDLGQFEKVPQMLINSARRLEDDLVYSVLTDNAAMADGVALFHADHKNLAGSAAAISIASLSVARAAMAKQKAPKGSHLNLVAAHLLVPVDIQTEAEQLVASLVDPTKSNDTPNPAFIRSLNVVGEPRLSADSTTAWYLAASTGQIDTVELCFLADEPEPVIEAEVDFDTDGMKVKVRHTCAAAAIDHRGLFKNPGA